MTPTKAVKRGAGPLPGSPRIVFFGSTKFAVPSIEALLGGGANKIIGLVTEGDRARGEGPDVPAGAWRIPILEPDDLEASETVGWLGQLSPDIQVVVGFERELPEAVLGVPSHGTVRVHPSLLPRHRGAAPIPHAILRGDHETGVTSFLMDGLGRDTGPVLLQKSTPIGEHEDAIELGQRLAKLAAEALVETLDGLREQSLVPQPQDGSQATEALPLSAEGGKLEWVLAARTLDRRVRAFQGSTGSHAILEGTTLRVVKASLGGTVTGEPGTVVSADFEGILVACGEGTSLRLTQLQIEGQRPMSPSAVISRLRLHSGARFD